MTIPKSTTAKIPAPLREGAKQVFTTTATLRPGFLPPPPPPLAASLVGATDVATLFAADSVNAGLAPDEAVLQSYLIFSGDETPAALAAFVTAGTALAERVDVCLRAMKQREESTSPPTDPPAGESLASTLARWQQEWRIVRRWWELWCAGAAPRGRLSAAGEVLALPGAPCLGADQRRAVDRLAAIWRARREDGAARDLPRGILSRWTHPMMVGPTGSGKAFAAQEAARRLGLAFARFEVGSWIIVANRSGRATVDLIGEFCAARPAGALIYLAGVDALTSARLGGERGESNSWWGGVASEVESFLDGASSRKPFDHDGSPRPFVVLGGRFGELWGEADVGGAGGAQAWRLADGEALTEPTAIADWITRHGGLIAGLAHRINPVPLVVGRPGREEAATLAAEFMAALPAALDGILDAGALTAALQSPAGWRAVAQLIEEGLIGEAIPVGNTFAQPPAPPGFPNR